MRQINLLPDEVQNQARRIFIKNSLCWTFIPVLAGMILVHVFVVVWLGVSEKFVQSPQAHQETTQVRTMREEMDGIKSLAQEFWAKDPDVVGAFVMPLPSVDILTEIGNAARAKIWLTELSLDLSQRTCTLSGESYTTRLANDFMVMLREQPYFKSVDLALMGKGDKKQGERVNFEINCELK